MSQLPQKYQTSKALPASAFSPQKMTIARQLNQDMAVVQSNEILAQDILNKVAALSELESQILAHNPQAQERVDFIIKAFTYASARRFK
ncbi:TPA: hypothetical protein TVR14_000432 [Streptococcus equi subsp. zooepidemicus]|uniref:hypothetical protein n=1 Tax=Streptococcus equi TaxID=1336 RepID=UPI0005BB5C17|nr:hypothetical protein [Streptococcus equi]HEL0726947.1 hypothetical protein [Streptococcus equi subsp. zooepidemicus]KIS11563.1 hypothetical protein AT51_00476 [Streptococcus equi subsp. zooepidemicus Sz57]HEL1077938.1 hypothetical protein [Streptococcus equi subsp. zooepidemicus]HEL1208965.1 hypothetical protein [Streptococcus equi subsp. zooepidemicus]HEL1266546.1 hypothetical protein [Streptococcus equi subsp. zooepidemicus]